MPRRSDKRAFERYVRYWDIGSGISKLEGMPPAAREALLQLRDGYRVALAASRKDDPTAPPRRFYLDYIDAPDENAWAFWVDGFYGIAITTPLLGAVERHAAFLSAEVTLANALGFSPIEMARLGPTFGNVLVAFFMGHEYAHCDLEHVGMLGLDAIDETEQESEEDQLQEQAFEVAADAWSMSLLLNHLILQDWRPVILQAIGQSQRNRVEQSRVLLSIVVAAVLGYFASRSGQFKSEKVRRSRYPPTSLRTKYMAEWIAYFFKSMPTDGLEAWFSPVTHNLLMSASVARLVQGRLLGERTFLQSAEGVRYENELTALVNIELAKGISRREIAP